MCVLEVMPFPLTSLEIRSLLFLQLHVNCLLYHDYYILMSSWGLPAGAATRAHETDTFAFANDLQVHHKCSGTFILIKLSSLEPAGKVESCQHCWQHSIVTPFTVHLRLRLGICFRDRERARNITSLLAT